MFSEKAFKIFEESIAQYHIADDVYQPFTNPYPSTDLLNHLLYRKNWIDTVQWHYEDIIRDPHIDPVAAMVEYIDSYFLDFYKEVKPLPEATINTESPAWAVDRLSILALKIYHMQEEVNRPDATPEHRAKCQEKLNVLLEQKKDLSTALNQLLDDIAAGRKYMKVYKQMKMYNDEELNPVLRGSK